jgi:antitoxin HicB
MISNRNARLKGSQRGAIPLAYPARLKAEEDGGYVVTFPDFGIGVTQGDNREEALAQAADLLETMVANYMAEGWDLPEPSPARGRPLVRLAPLVAAKAELFRATQCAGIDKAELARRLGIAPKDVERLFSIHHKTRLDQLEAALAVLGRRLVVSIEPA